jgi:hypothetical protein
VAKEPNMAVPKSSPDTPTAVTSILGLPSIAGKTLGVVDDFIVPIFFNDILIPLLFYYNF